VKRWVEQRVTDDQQAFTVVGDAATAMARRVSAKIDGGDDAGQRRFAVEGLQAPDRSATPTAAAKLLSVSAERRQFLDTHDAATSSQQPANIRAASSSAPLRSQQRHAH